MKTKFLVNICSLIVLVFVMTGFDALHKINNIESAIQETQTAIAVYDGHEDYGYSFISSREGEEYSLTFQRVNENVLNEFDLNLDVLVKTKFKITYTTKIIVTKDADGFDDENEINTITKLEKL